MGVGQLTLVCPGFSGFKIGNPTFRALPVPGKPGQLVALEKAGDLAAHSSKSHMRQADGLGRMRIRFGEKRGRDVRISLNRRAQVP